ncbi:ATP-binding protein [Streptomyces sp. J2-1]|uniref:ATP-binding protein n=1 Tax=Streptomyces corallincola TaxID=2851888 RepID=UPI001C38364C|nr:ATP-binding protein [Streptomyces corallincola]MBV2356897.1 ATP-binding protein [Streptomyces corallincola]
MNRHRTGGEPFYFSQRIRFTDQLSLVALSSAVSVARHFVRLALTKWHARSIEGDAALIVSELVTNAVKATGVLNSPPNWAELETTRPVTLRLVGLDAGIVIEVWDTTRELPVLRSPDDDTEGGRGLVLVQELAHTWGAHPTPHGKLVWAHLPVPEAVPEAAPEAVRPPLPHRRGPEPENAVRRPTMRADPRITDPRALNPRTLNPRALGRLLTGLRAG